MDQSSKLKINLHVKESLLILIIRQNKKILRKCTSSLFHFEFVQLQNNL